jgi:hypothetical protein
VLQWLEGVPKKEKKFTALAIGQGKNQLENSTLTIRIWKKVYREMKIQSSRRHHIYIRLKNSNLCLGLAVWSSTRDMKKS